MVRIYHDLCLNDAVIEALTVKERVSVASSLGYNVIGVSNYINNTSKLSNKDRCSIPEIELLQQKSFPQAHIDEQKAGKKKKRQKVMQDKNDRKTETTMMEEGGSSRIATAVSQTASKVHQLKRLTLSLADVPTCQELFSTSQSILHTYDIIAIIPGSDKVFQHACTILEVDIISLDCTKRFNFKLRHDMIKTAVERGVVFEVLYSPFVGSSIGSGAKKQQFFANVQALAQATGGKAILFSSGAGNVFEIRGPYDVVNMATFCGLTEEQAYDTVSKTPQGVISKAQRRLAFRGKMTMARMTPEDKDARFNPEPDVRHHTKKPTSDKLF